jgi:hypothetical protein
MHTGAALGTGQVFTTATLGLFGRMPSLQISRLRFEESFPAIRIREVGLVRFRL